MLKKDTLRMLRRIYKQVDQDEQCPIDQINAGLKAMYGQDLLNKTEAAKFLNISVSTFDKRLAAGIYPPGIKRGNETLKWKRTDLEKRLS